MTDSCRCHHDSRDGGQGDILRSVQTASRRNGRPPALSATLDREVKGKTSGGSPELGLDNGKDNGIQKTNLLSLQKTLVVLVIVQSNKPSPATKTLTCATCAALRHRARRSERASLAFGMIQVVACAPTGAAGTRLWGKVNAYFAPLVSSYGHF